MARARVEPPPGWAPCRLMIGALRRLGYQVTELRTFGAEAPASVLLLGQPAASAGATPSCRTTGPRPA